MDLAAPRSAALDARDFRLAGDGSLASGNASGGASGGRPGSLAEALAPILDRLESLEPEIQALLPEPGRRERILAEARALEARYPDADSRPPLYGLLLGVKDLFRAEGFPTRAGSKLPPELFSGSEAPSVSLLKAAGAIVLGKTVSTEFAYFAPGPTRNPRDTGRTPGGSSSGSAASVAAGFAHLALGTQTIGSIGRPAAFCGVAGLKPSRERVTREGVVPFAPSLDHVGLFAADCASLALAASVLLPGWRADAYARASRMSAAQASKPRLAVPEGPYLEQAEAGALASFRRTLARLEAAGYPIVPVPALKDIAEINERHRRIAAAEIARVHAEWYPAYKELYSQATGELIERGMGIGEEELRRDLGCLDVLRIELESALLAGGADFWLSPAALGPAPLGLSSTGSPLMNLPWTYAGLPTLVVPAGLSPEGLPLGLQIAGRMGRDEETLDLGAALESILL